VLAIASPLLDKSSRIIPAGLNSCTQLGLDIGHCFPQAPETLLGTPTFISITLVRHVQPMLPNLPFL